MLWKTVNNYTIDEAVASVQGVLYGDLYIPYPIPIPVMLYQCHLLGTDCTSCLAQNETHFDCVYCPETNCVFRSSCSVNPYDSCPDPMIDMVCYGRQCSVVVYVLVSCATFTRWNYYSSISQLLYENMH